MSVHRIHRHMQLPSQPAHIAANASDGLGKNKVFLNDDDIIEIHVVGDQTVASIDAMGTVVDRLGRTLRRKGKPVLIIDNLLQIGAVPPEGRKRVVDLGKLLDYDKLVMLGNHPFLRLGANLMLRATGRAHQLRYFEDPEAARQWLLAK